jgi:hypothetical protein
VSVNGGRILKVPGVGVTTMLQSAVVGFASCDCIDVAAVAQIVFFKF